MNSTKQRQQLIAEWVKQHGAASVQRLSEMFHVTTMTIRRDLEALSQEGKIQRFHGGARAWPETRPPRRASAPPGEERFSYLSEVDAIILNPMDERHALMLANECADRDIPLVLESIPLPGFKPLVAIDSYAAGVKLGRWIGRYAQEHWGGQARLLEIGWPNYEDTLERSRGLEDGLAETASQSQFVLRISGNGVRDESREVAAAALAVYSDINVVVGINDQSALGALDAMRQAKRPVDELLLATFGLEGVASRNELLQGAKHVVGAAMFPEFIGRTCAETAVLAYQKRALPDRIVTPTDILTNDTLDHYYRPGDGERIRWEAVYDLASREKAFVAADRISPTDRLPQKIGFIKYLRDDYYDSLLAGFCERCSELGVEPLVIDALSDWDESIALAQRQIAAIAASLVQPGESVILDAGRTCAQIAAQLHEREGVTVITHSIPVIKALEDARGIRLIGIGGLLDAASQAFVGAATQASYRALQADRAFLSVEGINVEYGLSNANIVEEDVKRAIIAAANEVTVVADFSKIGKITLSRIAPISDIQRLITDGSLTPSERLALAQAGVELIVANRKNKAAGHSSTSKP